MDNFIYILRSASLYFPSYFKFVLTIDPRKETATYKILKILATSTIIELSDFDMFKKEAKTYLEFALFYKNGKTEIQETEQDTNLVNRAVKISDKSYSKAVELITVIQQSDLDVEDREGLRDFLDSYISERPKISEIFKSLKAQDEEALQPLLSILCYMYGPMHLESLFKLLDPEKAEVTKNMLEQLSHILNLTNSQIQKVNPHASIREFIENNRTIVVVKRQRHFRYLAIEVGIQLDKSYIHEKILQHHLDFFENEETDSEFEELDTYFRLYIFNHLSKSSLKSAFNNLDNLFSAKNIYKQILYHRSYQRFRGKLTDLAHSENLPKDEKHSLIQFSNILFFIE